jgi:amphiphysin
MSFKGFAKAVARLPQRVLAKAGYTEETIDVEFNDLEERFKSLDVNAKKLHDDAKKFKDALSMMLQHQESFAVTLKEVYEPITSSMTMESRRPSVSSMDGDAVDSGASPRHSSSNKSVSNI